MAKLDHEIVQCSNDIGHLYRIYSNPTHDKHQWPLLQFIVLLMMDAKGVRNKYSIPAVVNKHNTARVASCWFIIYYYYIILYYIILYYIILYYIILYYIILYYIILYYIILYYIL